MKKTKLTLLVLGLSGAVCANADSLQGQVEGVAQQQIPTTVVDPLYSTNAMEAKVAEEAAKEAEGEKIVLQDPTTVLTSLQKEVEESATTTSLDKDAKYRAFLTLEQGKTAILQERATQNNIINTQNELIIKAAENKRKAEEKIVAQEEKEQQAKFEEQQAVLPPMITDSVSVLSVYGTNNNLFAEIKVNNNKYQVQKGQKFGDGFKAVDISRDGVKVTKEDVTQFIEVSANPTTINTQAQTQSAEPQEEQRKPNIIRPNSLY